MTEDFTAGEVQDSGPHAQTRTDFYEQGELTQEVRVLSLLTASHVTRGTSSSDRGAMGDTPQ
jgi:hypothetical protein